MFPNVNRALNICLQTFYTKNVTVVRLQRLRCLHKLLCTQSTHHAAKLKNPGLPEQTSTTLEMPFSSEETETILEKFNRSSRLELMRIQNISKKGANTIVEHRHEHGEFSNVSDLLKLACFKFLSHKRLKYMFHSILSPPDDNESQQNTAKNLTLQFSPEETEIILTKFNTSSEFEFVKIKSISAEGANTIVKHRSVHGQFKSFGDLLDIPLQHIVYKIPKICQSILSLSEDKLAGISQTKLSISPTDIETILHQLNTLSSEELAKKNLGGHLHENIVEYREENGLLESIEDLRNIPGIGPKKAKWICHAFGAKEVADDEYTLSPEVTETALDKFNNSSDLELLKVKYLSKDRAHGIVKYRCEHGQFKNVDDLLKMPFVRNLGPKRLQEMLASALSILTDSKSKDTTSTSDTLQIDLADTRSKDSPGKPDEVHVLTKSNLKLSSEESEKILYKLNNCPAFELMQFKSISRDIANAIVTQRRELGLFTSVDDILNILNSDCKKAAKKLATICRNILSAPTIITSSVDFSPTDTQSILHTLNTSSQQELANNKKIGKQLSELIVKYREKNGWFQRVEDLLGVQKIGLKKMKQVCQGLLSPNLKPVAEYVYNMERLQSVQDLVTIDVGLKHIAWLHMTKDREVLQWTVHNIDNITPAKWVPQEYFSVVKDIVSQLPTIDFYIIEHQPSIGQISNKNMFSSFVFVRALEALFLGLLNADIGHYGNLGAVSVSRNIAARHFDLMVGGNRVTAQPLVTTMLKDQRIQRNLTYASSFVGLPNDSANSSNVEGASKFTIDDHVARVFQSSSSYQKEHLANCLLQATLFFETVK
ncbi:uncharacterized protein [Amphiura filiformis]|uniref:uncharacterized protein n=1 Tax=Amphiura filiformis TaxID=82378 RepID=UPI003B223723